MGRRWVRGGSEVAEGCWFCPIVNNNGRQNVQLPVCNIDACLDQLYMKAVDQVIVPRSYVRVNTRVQWGLSLAVLTLLASTVVFASLYGVEHGKQKTMAPNTPSKCPVAHMRHDYNLTNFNDHPIITHGDRTYRSADYTGEIDECTLAYTEGLPTISYVDVYDNMRGRRLGDYECTAGATGTKFYKLCAGGGCVVGYVNSCDKSTVSNPKCLDVLSFQDSKEEVTHCKQSHWCEQWNKYYY